MGLLEDIQKTLERIPVWKRLVALPDKVEKLEARIAALEAKLGDKPGRECPLCGEHAMKTISTKPHPDFGFAGVKLDRLRCSACNHEEERDRRP